MTKLEYCCNQLNIEDYKKSEGVKSYEYTSSWGPMVRKTIVFISSCSQSKGEQPTSFWNFLVLHSSQIEKINLKDFVTLADRNPLSSPTSSSLLQCLYGFCDSICIFFGEKFLEMPIFLGLFKKLRSEICFIDFPTPL
jgi:hypothetical protein